ncbi:MAG: translational GTPase TypA [Candidatus Ancillula trichonymphae]|jgi:GTP-binding protein|nr:translational GTPase TypA [Candidatus Ancillula trichonymphae]
MSKREDLRNVAIVAHVDHGKTTLVDAMLKQTNSFGEREVVDDRAMDSGDLEREKGITILAKNTAIEYLDKRNSSSGTPVTINVIDTPGHADFGGEVERGLSMVDGVVLLVDSSEGPLPQTRFVLRKALIAKLPVIVVVNKVDRPDARISEVVSKTLDLLLGLASDLADEGMELDTDVVLNAPVIYASAKAGAASTNQPANGALPDDSNLEPLFSAILEYIPAPEFNPDGTCLAQVTNLDALPFLGRLALVRIYSGELIKGRSVAWIKNGKANGPGADIQTVKVTELLKTKALDRHPVEKAGPGDIVAIAGIPDISIGDTLADLANPRALDPIVVDDPAISATIGINTSPLAGRTPKMPAVKDKDRKVTARQVKDRLDRELIGNVSLRVLPTDRPDTWEVQARGELALAILVEQMRREGFELIVGKPQVVKKTINQKVHEPFEIATIDIPEEFMGEITQLMAARKGEMLHMMNHGSGWIRLEFSVPARGLIGFRTQFLTNTHGTGTISSISDGYKPWAGVIETRTVGSLVADRSGVATPFAMAKLQERGKFFVEPTQEVYEGMVVGQNSRNEDMVVNITKEKQLTNMRSATADIAESMAPPVKLTLEESLEFAAEDECVEVTPEFVRIRKVTLNNDQRAREQSRAKKST